MLANQSPFRPEEDYSSSWKLVYQYNQMYCSREYQLTSRFNQQYEKSTSNVTKLYLHHNTKVHHDMWVYDLIIIYVHYTMFNSIPMHTSISHPLGINTSNHFFLELYQSASDYRYTLGIPVLSLQPFPHDSPSRFVLLSHNSLSDFRLKTEHHRFHWKVFSSNLSIPVHLGLPHYHLSGHLT